MKSRTKQKAGRKEAQRFDHIEQAVRRFERKEAEYRNRQELLDRKNYYGNADPTPYSAVRRIKYPVHSV